MLHDLDRTLEKILVEQGRLNKNEIDIAFDQPTSEWSARLSRPTVNIYCFDLRENVKLRSMERQVSRNGNNAYTSFPVRRMDLMYLVTAWARKIEDEHQLLWRALGALKRVPKLDPRDCEGELRLQTHDIPLVVADMTNNPMNLVDLWSVMDNQMRLGFTITATVELDTSIGFESPLVLEAGIEVGLSERPITGEYTGEYVHMTHEAEREHFDATGEKKVTTKYENRMVTQKDADETEEGDS